MRFAALLLVGLVSGCVNINTSDSAGQYLNVLDQNHAFRYELTYSDSDTCAKAVAILSLVESGLPSYCSKTSRPNIPWYTYADYQNTRVYFHYQTFTDCLRELELLKKTPGLKIATACKTS